MHCGLCKRIIDKDHPFTDPKSHKKGCPIFATDKQLVKVIKGEGK